MLDSKYVLVGVFCGLLFALAVVDTRAERAEDLEFFEREVRPLIAAKCYECHSDRSDASKGGLRVDSRDHLLKGGDSGPAIVPGTADESLLATAIRWTDLEMPPDGKLTDDQIGTLEQWIDMGAPWTPEVSLPIESATEVTDWRQKAIQHWAFRPVRDPAVPHVRDKSWAGSPIDRFILSRLESADLWPAPSADATTLVRRIYFDLIGIPPTPQVVDQFREMAAIDLGQAVHCIVDRLLASPQYGERWGRHWLDVARYSDGLGGFLDNGALPHAWRYRDWVTDALNQDLPFDEFIRQQIAGDLTGSPEHAVATGFFALGPTYKSDGGDPDSIAQANGETLDDRVDTLSRGMMGLTVSCARCHDHKFDPIPQIDYYSIAGVFQNTGVKESPLAAPDVVAATKEHQQLVKGIQDRLKQRRQQLKKEQREPNEPERAELDEWQRQLDQLNASAPDPYPVATVLSDQGSSDMPVAIRGNLLRPGDTAPRRFLQAVVDQDNGIMRQGSGRIGLSMAISDPTNPLTARVFVNRVWMHHFAKGIVRTPSNFGTLGEPPTHPDLLDWLASRLIESGWSVKYLHRMILTSSTFRMSSQLNSDAMEVDADNRLVWRMNPRRLDVEAWRDSILAVTEHLDSRIGGAPVESIESRRRTLYFKVSRSGDRFETDRFLRLFDFPMMRATVADRPQSTVPPQYLFLINNPSMFDHASRLVARTHQDRAVDADRIDWIYRLLFGRLPTDDERALGLAFLDNQAAPDESRADRWNRYAQILLCSNEFMYLR